jgi:hypothetical protein
MNKLSDIRPSLMRFACLVGGLAVMSDESVHPHETRAWRRVDR